MNPLLAYVKDPHTIPFADGASFAAMAREHPLVHAGHLWFVAANEPARQVLTDKRLIIPSEGAARAGLMDLLPVQPSTEHRRMRRIVTPMTSHRRLEALQPQIDSIATDLVNALSAGETVDVVEAAKRLATHSTALLLGAPTESWDLLQRWADLTNVQMATALTTGMKEADVALGRRPQPLTPDEEAEVTYIITEAAQRLSPALDTAPVCPHAEERATAPRSAPVVSAQEALSVTRMLFMGGLDTVVASICSALYLLQENQPVWDAFQSGDLCGSQVFTESTRFSPAFPFIARKVSEPGAFHDQTQPGDVILVCVGPANHDPRVFEVPETFDPTRVQAPTIAFGRGAHHCVGQGLAERVCASFLEQWAARVPKYSIHGVIAARRSHAFGGPQAMEVSVP